MTPLVLACDNDDNMDDIQFYVDLAKSIEANETAVANGETVDKNTTRIEVLKTGAWATAKGKFTLTANDLQQMAQNFNSDVRPHSSTHGLPIDEEHSKKAALGWLKEPSVEANEKGGHTLFMNAHWTTPGLEKVKDGTYKFFSPEVHFQHDDPEGTLPKLRNVLMGGGVTNRPLFKGLAGIPALTASDGTADEDNKIYVSESEKEPKVDLTTIRAKQNNTEVTDEERKVLDAAKDQLTQEERDRFYPDESKAAKDAADKAAADKAAADKAEADKVAASEAANKDKTVTLDASEAEELRANAAAGLEASERLKRMDAETEVTEMCFSESSFKLPSDMKDEVTTLWLNASEEEKATLKKVFEKTAPLLSANDTREMGTGGGGGQGNAQSLLEDKVVELSASEAYKGKPYGEVLKAARAQNPEIAKEADKEEASAQPVVG